jgi:hypothetical protein
MTQEPESLLESDWLDEVLEGSGPPPGAGVVPDGSAPPTPVVVVPSGNRAQSWLPFVALIAALTLGGLLAASWRETRCLRVQALQARRAQERADEKARAAELELQWMAAQRPAVAMTPSPTPTEVRPDPVPAGTATATPETSGGPAAGKPQGSPPALAAGRPESPPSRRPWVLTRRAGKAQPTPTPSTRPDVAVPPSAPRTEAKTQVETAAIVPDGRSPFEGPEGTGGDGPARARADATAPVTKPVGPPVAAAAPDAPAAAPTSPTLEHANYSAALCPDPGQAAAYFNRGNARAAKKEYDRALVNYSEALRLDPGSADAYINRGIAWTAKGEYDRALADYSAALRLDPGQANAYNNRAWLWATCPDADHRDGKRAVASATRACELSGWKEACHIGTLAAASAEAGDFDTAVKWQSRANELYADAGDEKKGEERLRLYREKRPYRETPP